MRGKRNGVARQPTSSSRSSRSATCARALATKVEAARQPRASGGAAGSIELLPGRNFEHALCDLAEWQYIWVLFWFDRNEGWRPKVLPPRSRSGRKGVFATRSPHRPNPLGLSAVRLERVDGLTLHVSDVDMLDGTPVLDIKPYVAYTDAIADAGERLAHERATRRAIRSRRSRCSGTPSAAEQAAWVEARTGLAAARARDGDARARARAASVSADSARAERLHAVRQGLAAALRRRRAARARRIGRVRRAQVDARTARARSTPSSRCIARSARGGR